MRTFNEIQQELGLNRFLSGPLGTMYYTPYTPGHKQVNVRYFDSELPPRFVRAYVDLISAAQQWIEQHPDLAQLVWIDQPFEIGITSSRITRLLSTDSPGAGEAAAPGAAQQARRRLVL